MEGVTVLRLLFAALVGFSVSCTAFLSVAAQGTPEGSPEAKPRMPSYLAGNAFGL
jgi:hypothetical protein